MIAGLILLGIVSSVCSQSLHDMMKLEDLDSVFSVKSASEVPEYDVVPVSIVQSRKRRQNGLYISTERFGKHVKAWLNPMDGILAGEDTPVHILLKNPNGGRYPIVKSSNNLLGKILPKLYENKLHATTLAVNHHSNGKRSVTGYIGEYFIQPVPSHLMDHAKRHRRSVKGSLDDESDDQIYHIVHKIPKPEEFHYSPNIEALIASNRTSRSVKYQLSQYPEIIYPEILVIVDYYILAKFKEDYYKLILYILAFWNGVDMRYRDLVYPKVRFNINGIVICNEPNLLSYQMAGKFREGVDIDVSLTAKARWLYDMREFFGYGTYDIAVTMTVFNLCAHGAGCHILGVANLYGACTQNNVAMVKDSGSYAGVMTAAHELGHAFGMNHDDRTVRHCDETVGNVMAPAKTNTPDSYEWSYCSLVDFQNFLERQGGCLINKPAQQKPLHRFMPGMLMSADEQCEMILGHGIKTEKIDDSICTELQCTKNSMFKLPEAADGTTCGTGKMCLHGSCKFINEIN